MGTATADRLRSGWARLRGDRVTDVGVPALLVAVGALELGSTDIPGARWGILLEVVSAALLVWRRRWPVLVPTAAIAVLLAMPLVGPQLDDAAAPILFFAVGVYSMARWRADLVGLRGVVAVALLVGAVYVLVDTRAHNVGDAVFVLALLVPPYVAGRLVRRVDDARLLAERNQELVRAEAVRAERDRIAREMHDVIAHSISAMVVQTAAAQDLVRTDPDRAERALADVASAGRAALAETGRLLHLIRDDEHELGLVPAPGLAQVPALVEDFRARGLEVRLRLPEQLPDLPAVLDLTAYRIVQEALTNALKHGADRCTALTLTGEPHRLRIESTNRANGHPGPGSRLGLLGMGERVALVGGSLEHGPVDGRYELRASLPLGPA